MKYVSFIVATAALAVGVAGCASDPYYARNSYNYGYGPGYAYSSPGYYRTTSYGYGYPQQAYYYPQQGYTYPQRGGYDGYWDYQRNYRGVHASPEL